MIIDIEQIAYLSLNRGSHRAFERGLVVDQAPILAQWFSHYNLHHWILTNVMVPDMLNGKLKGEVRSDDTEIELNVDELENLRLMVLAGMLPPTNLFFINSLDPDGEQQDKDLEFIESAIEWIGQGQRVFYNYRLCPTIPLDNDPEPVLQ